MAAAFDLPIIAVFAAASGLIGLWVRPRGLVATPAGWDTYAFSTLVTPVAFALWESSGRHATPGKRRLWVVVLDGQMRGLSLRRSLARSGVKFAPWQMAHTAVFHLMDGSTSVALVALSISARSSCWLPSV